MNPLVFVRRFVIASFFICVAAIGIFTLLCVHADIGIDYFPKVIKGFAKEVMLRKYGPKVIPAHKFIIPTIKLAFKAVTAQKAPSYHEQLLGFDMHFFLPHFFLFGFYEIFFRDIYYFKADNTSPFIIDCGANIGMATLYFKMLYPQSEVLAFEPSAGCYEVLKKNVSANKLPNVTIINKAVSDKKGYCSFWDPSHGEGDGRASILVKSTDCTKVETVLLSDYITKPVDLLKIDIEGSEHNLLQELVTSGKISMIKQIVMEYHHHIPSNKINRLGNFLSMLEQQNFGYQIRSCGVGVGLQYDQDEVQLMIIHAYNLKQTVHE